MTIQPDFPISLGEVNELNWQHPVYSWIRTEVEGDAVMAFGAGKLLLDYINRSHILLW